MESHVKIGGKWGPSYLQTSPFETFKFVYQTFKVHWITYHDLGKFRECPGFSSQGDIFCASSDFQHVALSSFCGEAVVEPEFPELGIWGWWLRSEERSTMSAAYCKSQSAKCSSACDRSSNVTWKVWENAKTNEAWVIIRAWIPLWLLGHSESSLYYCPVSVLI